jgi:hypothetical protein
MNTVFVAFLVIGMAMPVLPLHLHQGLGPGASVVGLVAGSQFAAAILSRVCKPPRYLIRDRAGANADF